MITTAFINLWGQRVGAIAWDANTGVASFEYEPNFVNTNLPIAPLTMPVANAAGRVFAFPELRATTTFKGLPGLLADVLPDKYGNSLINVWLAKNGRTANSMNPVEQLCFIGKRGMGALEFEPAAPKTTTTATQLELDSLIHIAQQIVEGRQNFNTNISENEEKALLDILKIGTSAGGARAKAVIAYNEATREVRSGQANAGKGFTHWLLKFDGVTDQQIGTTLGYGRIEMAYYLMATAAGINMMECRLLEENNRAHFMTRRFDREGNNTKKHIQSFCAMAHYDFNQVGVYSYEQLFETMRALLLPYTDAEQLYRRMVFNVMARNCDDHTKNFAFIMDTHGKWRLSPAYDVCYAYRPGSTWVSQHAMSINGKRQNISKNDLLALAKMQNIKKAESIITEVRDVVAQWSQFAAQVQVDAALVNQIEKTLLLNI